MALASFCDHFLFVGGGGVAWRGMELNDCSVTVRQFLNESKFIGSSPIIGLFSDFRT